MTYSKYFNNDFSSVRPLPLSVTVKGTNTIKKGWNGALEGISMAPVIPTLYGLASPADLFTVDLSEAKTVPMQAIVLAGGEGKRMRPLTELVPKPLVPVDDMPLADFSLDLLEAAGVTRVIMNTLYLAEQIQDYATGRNRRLDNATEYTTVNQSELKNPLSGSFLRVLSTALNGPTFISNADTIIMPTQGRYDTLNPFLALAQEHNESGNDATLLMCHRDHAIGHDGPADYSVNDDGALVWEDSKTGNADHVYMGAAIITPSFVRRVVKEKLLDRGCNQAGGTVESSAVHKLFSKFADPKTRVMQGVGVAVHNGAYYDVANPEMLEQAERAVASLPVRNL